MEDNTLSIMDCSKVFTVDSTVPGDGLPVRADVRTSLRGAERPVIVICPGFLAYRRWGFFPWVSDRLASAGYHVVTISFSHSGTDDGTGMITRPDEFASDTVSAEISDLERVIRWTGSSAFPFPAAPPRGLLGHSRGGSVCLLSAATFPEVASIVTWSAPSRLDRYTDRRKDDWKKTGYLEFTDSRSPVPLRLDYSYYADIEMNRDRFDLPGAAARIGIPHLLVHGERDAAVSISEAKAFFERPGRGRRVLETVRGCGHTFGVSHPMGAPTPALERAMERTIEWFASSLPAG
jgi:pimeloyl-ACP methyl ester carboxylesterase